MDKVVEAAKVGKVNVAQVYESLVKEIVIESGLTERNLEAIGLPLTVPHFRALPPDLTCNYMNAIYPNGRVQGSSMSWWEEKACILSSLLHIGSWQEPTVDGMRAVLRQMPVAYLMKSWMTSKSNAASNTSETVFMHFSGNEAGAPEPKPPSLVQKP